MGILLRFQGAQFTKLGYQIVELHVVNCFICIVFSDVGVLTYDAGAPSGGETSSICRNSPNYSKMDLAVPSTLSYIYIK
jgi:hypothetical protein